MGLFTFKGGVHPLENKISTENRNIEKMIEPKKVYISLLQHIGSPLEPIVKIGDIVKKGEKIAESKATLSAPVHSSVSGKVIKIERMPFPVNGKINTIIIENDEQEDWIELNPVSDYTKLSKEELLNIIKECGIVGLGGAAFPTSVKLNPSNDVIIDTLIINASECEPYLNADNRVIIENTAEVIKGIKIMKYILGAKKAIIGIENNKKEAYTKLLEYLKNSEDISVALLKTKYPQGGEKQLIKAILNRVVKVKQLPSSVGVIVQNISTAKAIHDAVILGKPLIERVVTVSGNGVSNPKNLLVKIGTLFREILDYCEVDYEKTVKIISGGPMMGISQYTVDVPAIKGTSGILAFTKEEARRSEPHSCISCGKCITACPMNLLPVMFAKLATFEKWENLEEYNIMDCIECGSCAYICPSHRPLTEGIKIGKAKLRGMKK
ncbi:MAG: electron transport complex subunit RsxC [Fusobacteria bacterium]|nr:electron transport complex subunit RsxC [Fusobacteriota bacterium]